MKQDRVKGKSKVIKGGHNKAQGKLSQLADSAQETFDAMKKFVGTVQKTFGNGEEKLSDAKKKSGKK